VALLADHTTLRVGGPAADWVIARSEDDLVSAVTGLDASGVPVLVLGGGSNLLVADAGFAGTVVEVATSGLEASTAGDRTLLTVAAGVPWDDVVAHAVTHGWSGVEALSGVPGRAGATPIQNVGAYGQDVSQVLASVRVLDRRTATVTTLDRSDCGFGYRTSRFKREPDRFVVLSISLSLAREPQGVVRYDELGAALGVPTGGAADVGSIREAVLALRRRKGMVLDAADPDTWSAGSFFTNPVVGADEAAVIPAACPRYPAQDGVKLSAAWLIENAGIDRGYRLGPDARAAISSKHTLALSNRGGASAGEVVELARDVRSRVAAAFGVRLEAEPVLVGLAL
jgi:UDP-N-acetylmuramate dehydrogenase